MLIGPAIADALPHCSKPVSPDPTRRLPICPLIAKRVTASRVLEAVMRHRHIQLGVGVC